MSATPSTSPREASWGCGCAVRLANDGTGFLQACAEHSVTGAPVRTEIKPEEQS
jgi:hypothetical protein